MISLQPHSGAAMLALRYHLKHPKYSTFDVRMTGSKSKVYRIVFSSKERDSITFRTGKDWPCYSKIRYNSNFTEFTLTHNHSHVNENYKVSRDSLYSGILETEAGLMIRFKGSFGSDTSLSLTEQFVLPSGRSVYLPSNYKIDGQWE